MTSTFDDKIRALVSQQAAVGRTLSFDELRQILDGLLDHSFSLHIPAYSEKQQSFLKRVAIPRDRLRPFITAYSLSFQRAAAVPAALDIAASFLPDLQAKDAVFARLQRAASSLLRVVKDHKLLLSYRLPWPSRRSTAPSSRCSTAPPMTPPAPACWAPTPTCSSRASSRPIG